MECTLCYEIFVIIKTKEEEKKEWNKIKKGGIDNISYFLNLWITPEYDPSYTCSNKKCNNIICGNCWETINNNFQLLYETEPILPYWGEIKCPFCRQTDWRYYMKQYVLDELQNKFLYSSE
jgi:hypothetical protein